MSLKVLVSEKDHIQGDANAKCALVEYGDYECPHCGRAYPIVKRVQKHFGKRMRFVYRNFPLNEAHPHAESAAETAEFAGSKGKYWEMHDLLFENQLQLGGPLYLKLSSELGLSEKELRGALEKREFATHLKSDFLGGVRSGVNGTPTFFINGERHDGPFDFEELIAAIEGSLTLT